MVTVRFPQKDLLKRCHYRKLCKFVLNIKKDFSRGLIPSFENDIIQLERLICFTATSRHEVNCNGQSNFGFIKSIAIDEGSNIVLCLFNTSRNGLDTFVIQS